MSSRGEHDVAVRADHKRTRAVDLYALGIVFIRDLKKSKSRCSVLTSQLWTATQKRLVVDPLEYLNEHFVLRDLLDVKFGRLLLV